MPVAITHDSNQLGNLNAQDAKWLHYGKQDMGIFTIGNIRVKIQMYEHYIQIGCHKADITALQKLVELHECHFSKPEQVLIQNGIE